MVGAASAGSDAWRSLEGGRNFQIFRKISSPQACWRSNGILICGPGGVGKSVQNKPKGNSVDANQTANVGMPNWRQRTCYDNDLLVCFDM